MKAIRYARRCGHICHARRLTLWERLKNWCRKTAARYCDDA